MQSFQHTRGLGVFVQFVAPAARHVPDQDVGCSSCTDRWEDEHPDDRGGAPGPRQLGARVFLHLAAATTTIMAATTTTTTTTTISSTTTNPIGSSSSTTVV